MKSLLAGLLVIAALPTAIPFAVPLFVAQTPVEQKVVEIHMMRNLPPSEQADHTVTVEFSQLLPGHGTCSGEFIDSTGDILTARHCVDGFDGFEVQTADRRRYTAVVLAISASHDLALMHIDRSNTPHFEFAKTATRGETVFVLGSPLGITDTLSTGIIARIDGDRMLLDCSALPGNSGGPVFNKDGELVGVLTAGFIVMFGVTHLNIAQGLDTVRFFIQEAAERRYGR